MRLPLPLDSYRRTSPERLVNCYAEAKPADAKGEVALVRAPGITRIADLSAPGRGLTLFAGALWGIAGFRLYRIDVGTGLIKNVGHINGTGRVSVASTMDRLCVLGGYTAYLVTSLGAVTKVTDVDFRTATAVEFLDNYLLFIEASSGRFFSSDLNAPEDYDPLNFATAEGQPDDLVGLAADHGQLFLAGAASCELWANVGGAGFPFARVSNGLIELGCAAGKSIAKLDNSIFWLASDLTVRRLSGMTPQRVSTHGVEVALQGYGDVRDAYGVSYTFGGHLHYALTVPGRGTWVYDVTTSRWHERKSYAQAHWEVIATAQFGVDVWAIHEDGRVGVMQAGRYTEFGDPQVVSWTNAPLYMDGERVSLAEVELSIKTQP